LRFKKSRTIVAVISSLSLFCSTAFGQNKDVTKPDWKTISTLNKNTLNKAARVKIGKIVSVGGSVTLDARAVGKGGNGRFMLAPFLKHQTVISQY